MCGELGTASYLTVMLDKVLFPAKGPHAGRNINRDNMVRPWLFLFPALFVLGLYLAYPVFETLRLSLIDRSQDNAFVGLANYTRAFGDAEFGRALLVTVYYVIGTVPAGEIPATLGRTCFVLLADQVVSHSHVPLVPVLTAVQKHDLRGVVVEIHVAPRRSQLLQVSDSAG